MGENTACFGSADDFAAVGHVCVCVRARVQRGTCPGLYTVLKSPESKHLNAQQLSSKLTSKSTVQG